MEVSGRIPDREYNPTNTTHDQNTPPNATCDKETHTNATLDQNTPTNATCDPCEFAGEKQDAEFYCTECDEFMCFSCAQSHQRQRATRKHDLLNGGDLPRKRPSLHTEIKCSKHGDKPFDYFCNDHNAVCCSVCVTLEHLSCDREYILNHVDKFKNGGEYEALLQKLKELEKLLQDVTSEVDRNVATATRVSDSIVDEIRKFRTEINDKVDSLEHKALERAKIIKNRNIKAMSDLTSELDSMKSQIDETSTTLENFYSLKQHKQLIITSNLRKASIAALENRITELSIENNISKYQFCRNEEFVRFINSTLELGSIEEIVNGSDEGNEKHENLSDKKTVLKKRKTNTLTSSSKTQTETTTLNKSPQKQNETVTLNISPQKQTDFTTLSTSTQKQTETTTLNTPPQKQSETNTLNTSLRKQIEPTTLSTSSQKQTQTTTLNTSLKIQTETTALSKTKQKQPDKIPLTVKLQKSINIKHKEDRSWLGCWITGSTMLDNNRLVLVDHTSCSVKILDMTQSNITHYLKLESSPRDITQTDEGQLVLTAPSIQSLLFINFRGFFWKTLTVDRQLKVGGECYGIDYGKNMFIVSFRQPGLVKFIKTDGHTVRTISTDSSGQPLFDFPTYVVFSKDKQSVYVSDRIKHSITHLDMNGTVLGVYTSNDLTKPLGVTVDRHNNVYIAGWSPGNICVLTAGSTQIQPVVNVNIPQSVLVCDDSDQIIVSHYYFFNPTQNNKLSVYKMH